ncbi:MAG TPA: hypothetical protein VE544_11980 [Nitrososphaeraceae archaeon]|nr:hypothetical protein [Nitrososphaeraceae archaeon]
MIKNSITTGHKIVINWVLTLKALVLQSWIEYQRSMLRSYFLKAGFSDFNAERIEVTIAQTDTAEEFWQGMTEVTGFLVILLSKLPDEKKLAIKNDVIESLNKIFPSGSPVKFTGELLLGTGTKPSQ